MKSFLILLYFSEVNNFFSFIARSINFYILFLIIRTNIKSSLKYEGLISRCGLKWIYILRVRNYDYRRPTRKFNYVNISILTFQFEPILISLLNLKVIEEVHNEGPEIKTIMVLTDFWSQFSEYFLTIQLNNIKFLNDQFFCQPETAPYLRIFK